MRLDPQWLGVKDSSTRGWQIFSRRYTFLFGRRNGRSRGLLRGIVYLINKQRWFDLILEANLNFGRDWRQWRKKNNWNGVRSPERKCRLVFNDWTMVRYVDDCHMEIAMVLLSKCCVKNANLRCNCTDLPLPPFSISSLTLCVYLQKVWK